VSESQSETFLTSKQIRARYGGLSKMWIERRLADNSGFPHPIKLGHLRFWKLAEIEAWERASAMKHASAPKAKKSKTPDAA
jgi:predicted DNA-binding transcriptional regulator AlpA